MILSSCFYGFVLTLTFETILAVSPLASSLRGQELVDYINNRQSLWTAKLNHKFNSMDDHAKRRMMGLRNVVNPNQHRLPLAESRFLDINLPKNFDAREHWPKCQNIKEIRDQSMCGSCWAFGAVEAMSDRICVASKGEIQVHLSAVDLLSCCPDAYGCDGAETIDVAWKYWVSNGIVSGSNYSPKEGCKPYPFAPCDPVGSNKTTYPPCPKAIYETPKCEKKCQSSYDQKTYEGDKHYGSNFYTVPYGDVEAIQKEIYTHGSVEAAMLVHDDFMNYHDGIYTHEGGGVAGPHAVKLIGWGEQNGTPYWIGANSWNTDWGNKGFFRIIRGKNMVEIESQILGGLPDLNRTRIHHRS